MISLFKKHWLARQARVQASSPTSRDTRGYTLQTVIVSAILLSTAVLASVVLYRAITTNTDVRAFADLTGDNAPTRPHGFSVEHYLHTDDPDADNPEYIPSARVRWSPPLYTGQPQLAGSPTLLGYKTTHHCEDSEGSDLEDVTIPDTDMPEELMRPELLQIELVGNRQDVLGSTIDYDDYLTIHCLIRVSAFTCPEPSPITPCEADGTEIDGLSAEHRFTISKTPTVPEILEVRSIELGTQQHLMISWENPEYLGTNDHERLIYQIEQRNRAAVDDPPDDYEYDSMDTNCTFNNFYILSTMDNRLYDVRITPQIIIAGDIEMIREDALNSDNVFQNESDCRNPDEVISGDENSVIELLDLNPESFKIPETPTISSIFPTDSDPNSFDAQPLVENDLTEELVSFTIDWTSDTSVDSYLFQWNRADGTGTVESREFTEDPITLSLNNGFAYNFSLWARNSQGISDPLEVCTTVATEHRYLTPNLSVIPRGDELKINIMKPNQARYCQFESFCLESNTCQPPSIGLTLDDQYKIRIFKETNCTDPPDLFPNTTCTSEDIVICRDAPVDIGLETEIIVSALDEDTEYTVEVIAGTNCDATRKEIGNNTSPFASFPVAANAMTTSATSNISPSDIMPGSPMLMYNSGVDMNWTVRWAAPSNTDNFELYLAIFKLFRDDGTQATVTSSLEVGRNIINFNHDNRLDTDDEEIMCTINSDNLAGDCTVPDDVDTDIQLEVTIFAIYTDRASEPATVTATGTP